MQTVATQTNEHAADSGDTACRARIAVAETKPHITPEPEAENDDMKKAVKENPDVKAALKSRGITDFAAVAQPLYSRPPDISWRLCAAHAPRSYMSGARFMHAAASAFARSGIL